MTMAYKTVDLKNKYVISLLVFLGGGLIGPILRWATWPPAPESHSEVVVYDLVFLLWPSQILGAIEASVGKSLALLYTVSLNLVIFLILWLFVSLVFGKTKNYLFAYLPISLCVLYYALWGSGFSIGSFSILALVVALIFYGVLVELARKQFHNSDAGASEIEGSD